MNYKKIIGIAIILVLLLLAFFGVKNYINRGITIASITNSLKHKTDTATKYMDLYKSEHARAEDERVNRQTAEILYKDKLDSQARRLKVPAKRIGEHSDIGAAKQGYIQFTVDELDSIIKQAQNARGTPGVTTGGVKFKNKYVYIPFADSINLQLNKFWDRDRFLFWKHGIFLQRKKWYVDVYSEDTGVKVNKFHNIHIADEYSPLALSVTAGVTVPNLRPAIVVGVSYTPNFLRFKKRR